MAAQMTKLLFEQPLNATASSSLSILPRSIANKLTNGSVDIPLILLLIALPALQVMKEYIGYWLMMTSSNFYSILIERDQSGFAENMKPFSMYLAIISVLAGLIKVISDSIILRGQRNLGLALQKRYVAEGVLNRIAELSEGTNVSGDIPSIDNPDHRITMDVAALVKQGTFLYSSVISLPLLTAFYGYQATERSVPWVVPAVIGYVIISVALTQAFTPSIASLTFDKQRVEGDFRLGHASLRREAENIAFCRGELAEREFLDRAWARIQDVMRRLIPLEGGMETVSVLFQYFGSILNYLIMAIVFFSMDRGSMTDADTATFIGQSSSVLISLIYTVTSLLQLVDNYAVFKGQYRRVSQLQSVLDQVSSDNNELNNASVDIELKSKEKTKNDDIILLDGVTITVPATQKVLVKELTLKITSDTKGLLIRGGNGAGKTSIARCLAGVWPVASGTISIPDKVMFIPQAPFVPSGTLIDIMTYPRVGESDSYVMAQLLSLLNDLRLSHLFDRYYDAQTGTFAEHSSLQWAQELSPGEAQKLALLRVLFQRPKFVILDESTAFVEATVQEFVYVQLDILCITYISISHDPQLVKYHQQILNLTGEGGYTLE